MKYIPLDNKTALHKITNSRLPFTYECNIYRGCEHQCQYCYAIYSQDYLQDNYFHTIYYKKNIVEALQKELSKTTFKKKTICFGGVCDSYQPIEKQLKLMREILKILIEYPTPIIILTKSDLILRDLDLIAQLSEKTHVTISTTVTCMDEDLRKVLEPNASYSRNRISALKQIKKYTSATVGVHISPIIPFLNDSYENLNSIYRLAREINADYVLPGTLYLKGKTKYHFLNFIKKYDIEKYNLILRYFSDKEFSQDYKKQLYTKVNILKSFYHFS